ncbi:TPA: omptin family outer membrane protease [Enterobacter asburiae]|jgi:plasminogen activator|uniref:omptin family outer membrane protease n=1 Tax=Enterobacter asburiae TaxID=61645 RepID=UPI0007B33131|nr:omptin family outer membrane protease [Enterobacter asburiae]KZR41188.1 protease [Enterobacter asburiae]MCM7686442.1 omptin family outer membrane protease [Enterobacter asburiae]HDR2697060.1 omptin family outer membrane protease [Enterobacter asburiae]HDR2700972.1 omptin family outer membrane protease [Enterobacter asburiae]HDS3792855.1 omptin family outer membrane protease [Enterobacter asburiae]
MTRNIVAGMMMAAFSGAVYAGPTIVTPDFSPESLAVSASAGMLSGKSHEMVYDEATGRKISQLDWKIKNVAILKGDITWDAYSFLTLNARGWTSLASGSGHMDDYDWMNAKQSSWTDHSSHPATNVNYANEYDLNVKGWIFQGDNYKAGVTAGYQETRFSWTATGGTYNYDNGAYQGNFPAGERGIGYSQRFTMPYIGLAGQYRFNDFEFNALFKFSDWVRAHDNDEHYMRDLTFREKTTDSRYYGASVDAGYYVTPHAKVFAEFTYSSYEEGKGGTQIIDTNTGDSGSIGGDAAGISNHNYTITAGLQYRF